MKREGKDNAIVRLSSSNVGYKSSLQVRIWRHTYIERNSYALHTSASISIKKTYQFL